MDNGEFTAKDSVKFILTDTLMQNKFSFAKAAVLAGAALLSSQASAAGFQLNAQSATGIGRAFAGDAVIADNASVMARNPAAMALFDETSLSLGFETIATDIEVKDAFYTCKSARLCGPTTTPQRVDHSDIGGTSVAPNIHVIVPIDEKFAVGVNLYSNFGTATEFSNDYVAASYGGLTDLQTINLGFSGSYRLNEQWSFGAGLDIIYGTGVLQRGTDASSLDVDVAGLDFGFNVGTVYEMDENNRFGFSYRYSPEVEAKGDVMYAAPVEDYDPDGSVFMPLPDIAEFSGYHRIEDTKFAVHYSVQWIGWDVFESLEGHVNGSDYTFKEYQWQDGWHYAIGGTYYLNSDWTLRVGYMLDKTAQDQLTSISVPDSDRQWFSTGFTYHIDTKSNIDFGFTYLMGEDVEVYEETALVPGGAPISTVTATTRANAILMGLQYSRSF